MRQVQNEVSRREFIKTGAAATAALAAPLILPRSVFGANERIRVAVLGVNGRGKDHIKGMMNQPGVEVATLCDPDSTISAERAKEFEKSYNRPVKTEQDLRRVFDDKEIDAVTIATPNHWHALAAIWACQAGKDVYVEKPGTHNVWEGRKLIEAAAKYSRIVQNGVQLRSSAAIQEAIGHLRKGTIGQVYMARGLVFRWRPDIGIKPDEPVPPGLDYDLWLGPARYRPFSRNHVHYNWHWTWEFGNGDVGNQGIHETDLCMWGLDVGLPNIVTAMGGKFTFNDAKETPEVLTTLYHYPEQKKLIQFEVRHWCTNTEDGATVGNIFYGTEGYLVVKGYSEYEIFFGKNREPGPKNNAGGDHYANFIAAMRARDPKIQNGPVETVHLSSALAHLGNISYRLGRTLKFDPEKEKFIGDKDANKMLKRKYRKPYVIPDKV
ncbi:MAG TPA: Gfo/Idh/MocA family oxidoreductase [bacterium]|nr:Gfo/Idh/MocA family oxidoreductase [bacterium]